MSKEVGVGGRFDIFLDSDRELAFPLLLIAETWQFLSSGKVPLYLFVA